MKENCDDVWIQSILKIKTRRKLMLKDKEMVKGKDARIKRRNVRILRIKKRRTVRMEGLREGEL